ncbi:MAG: hypothetical protein Q9195_006464 [Heterodermia aff. obscurata]
MDTSGLSTDAEANHDASIQATAAVFCFLSIAATALRVYARKTKGVPLAVDDYLIFLSLTLAISESILYAYGAKHYGLGRHLLGLNKQQLVDYAKVYYVSPTCVASAKMAILILYYKVFATKKFRTWVRIIGTIVVLWWIGVVLAEALICIPVAYNWNKSIKGHCGSSAWNRNLNPLPWILTDAAILVMPIPMIRKLQLPRIQRIGLIGLFLLGGIATLSSIIRYIIVFQINKDITWSIANATIWNIIEAHTAVMSGCLVVLRPVVIRMLPGSSFFYRLRSKTSNSRYREKKSNSKNQGDFERLQVPAPAITAVRHPTTIDLERGEEVTDYTNIYNGKKHSRQFK